MQPLRRRGAVARAARATAMRKSDDRLGKLQRARRRLAHPEWNTRRQPLGIVDPDFARTDAANAPGAVAQEEKYRRPRLSMAKSSCTVPTKVSRGELDNIVIRGIGNRAAVGDRGQARAAPRPQHAVDPIAMNVGAAPAAPRLHAFAEHFQNLLEFFPRKSR